MSWNIENLYKQVDSFAEVKMINARFSLLPDTRPHRLSPDHDAADQDTVAQDDPPSVEVSIPKQETPKFTTSIFTEAVQFLLQNSALQVSSDKVPGTQTTGIYTK